MKKYIIKRLLQAIPLLVLISFIVFGLIELAPYDVIDSLVTPNMSTEQIEIIKEQNGLNLPFIVRYFSWLKHVLTGDFGRSLVNNALISEQLAMRIPRTIMLVLPAYLTAMGIAIWLGLLSAKHKGGRLDSFIDALASLTMATPTFWFALLLIYVFGYYFDLFPILGMHDIGQEGSTWDYLHHLFLPYLTLTFNFFPSLTRYVRSMALDQMDKDYVLVQRAFKASEHTILWKHVAKNIMIPIVTRIGLDLPVLVTGAMITETIFAWPGVGPYLMSATTALDYPVIMAILLITAITVIIGNLLADILYTVVDPRIGGEMK
ncbi:MAG: ABC transporter permease [Aerococcus sp.]|nr:ABC transporter permease [Aerococcus sp.]